MKELALSLIDESPRNPRRLFDPLKLEELAASIRRHGLLEPLVVRKVDGRYQLIAGARRYRAALLAKRKSVPVVVRRASDLEAVELMLVENLQRAELELLDECEAYHALVDQHGYSQARIAEAIGKSQAHVSRIMALRDLTPEARTALLEGRIGQSHAFELARVTPAEQRRALKVQAPSSHGHQIGIQDLKRTLRPMEPKVTGRGDVVDVQRRCWMCERTLVFDTDGMGKTVVSCPPCLANVRQLHKTIATLQARIKALEAAA